MEIEEIIKELRAQLNTFEIKLANLDKCHLNTSAQIQAWADTKKELLTEIAALKNEIESRHDSILSEKDKILKKNAAPATGLTGDCDIDGVIEV